MARFRVYILDSIAPDTEPETAVLGEIAEVISLPAKHESELEGAFEDADGLLVFNLPFTASSIDRLKNCRAIVRCGVGYDNIAHAHARSRGIPVMNVPDYGTEEVADTAIGMMLSLVRGIHLFNSRLQRNAGEWTYKQAMPLTRLRGKVFGVIGLGCIGTAAALRAKALGMDVAYFDPHKPDGSDKALGLRRVESLKELLGQSHVVSLHTPLTPDTHHILNAAAIALMPRGSFLVNTSRGGCVDLAAVPPAIASGHLAGAAIDVLPEEPPPADHPLLVAWRDPHHPCHDRLIVNPHSAFYSVEGLRDMRSKGAEACRRALLGLPLRNVVN